MNSARRSASAKPAATRPRRATSVKKRATRKPAPQLRGGVDLGGTKINAVVVDDANTVLGQARAETPRDGGPPAVAEAIAAALHDATEAAGTAPAELAGVGVGSPGAVDAASGSVAAASNLPDWSEPYPLGDELARRFSTTVRVGNDVTVATRAEFELGAGRDHDSLLGVFWGSGVGGGIILDGVVWEGRGAAGEFGHQVVRRRGALCGCGNRGCVEAYAGRMSMEGWAGRREEQGKQTELFAIARERGKDRLTSSVWARAYHDGDRVAIRALDRAADALGAGIASAVNLLDLPAVVVGGGMGERFWETHGPRIASAMQSHLFQRDAPPALMPSALGDLAGALGATLLAR
jgi:glucokinase